MKRLLVVLSSLLLAMAGTSALAHAATNSIYNSTAPKALQCRDIVLLVRNKDTSAKALEQALTDVQGILLFYERARHVANTTDYEEKSKDIVALRSRENECAEALHQALKK
jgi:ATP-dependent exoDNAse (exonuclease V) beta subunit